jgi:hypothetical protein
MHYNYALNRAGSTIQPLGEATTSGSQKLPGFSPCGVSHLCGRISTGYMAVGDGSS